MRTCELLKGATEYAQIFALIFRIRCRHEQAPDRLHSRWFQSWQRIYLSWHRENVADEQLAVVLVREVEVVAHGAIISAEIGNMHSITLSRFQS